MLGGIQGVGEGDMTKGRYPHKMLLIRETQGLLHQTCAKCFTYTFPLSACSSPQRESLWTPIL